MVLAVFFLETILYIGFYVLSQSKIVNRVLLNLQGRDGLRAIPDFYPDPEQEIR